MNMGRVSLFASCFNDLLFPNTVSSAKKVLERLNIEVDFPMSQTCCGQMHFNTGYASDAIPLLRNFVNTFADAEIIVTLSGSCTSMIKDRYISLAQRTNDAGFLRDVERIVQSTYEFSQYLTDVLGVINLGANYSGRVTYHPTCHSMRSLHIYHNVINLLKAVNGIELVELPNWDQCCGFGGTFTMKNPLISSAILDDKIESILKSNVRTVVALDNSCLVHIFGGLSKRGSDVEVKHVAEILVNT